MEQLFFSRKSGKYPDKDFWTTHLLGSEAIFSSIHNFTISNIDTPWRVNILRIQFIHSDTCGCVDQDVLVLQNIWTMESKI